MLLEDVGGDVIGKKTNLKKILFPYSKLLLHLLFKKLSIHHLVL